MPFPTLDNKKISTRKFYVVLSLLCLSTVLLAFAISHHVKDALNYACRSRVIVKSDEMYEAFALAAVYRVNPYKKVSPGEQIEIQLKDPDDWSSPRLVKVYSWVTDQWKENDINMSRSRREYEYSVFGIRRQLWLYENYPQDIAFSLNANLTCHGIFPPV